MAADAIGGVRPGGPVFGRFAPSPTGALHAGSLVAALASWLDVRAAGGRWEVRIEDVDRPRNSPGADRALLAQLAACGLVPDAPPVWQSQREALYAAALDRLRAAGRAYPCTCSRSEIAAALAAAGAAPARHGERVYPGTCRPGAGPPVPADAAQRPAGSAGAAAWRLLTAPGPGRDPVLAWHDRRLGPQSQDVAAEVGDFVLRRADGLWAYQLAVVVDDAAQGITDVVRGEDLADNTARQILLQQALGLPRPRYLHTPLVLAADGQKLSKQTGALPLAVDDPASALRALRAAATVLGLADGGLHGDPAPALADWLARAVAAWARRWPAEVA